MNIKNIRELKNVNQRRRYLETKLGVKLTNIGTYSLDETVASTKNCENMIGVSQIPLGVAGPLKINGSNAQGDFFIPLAITEGALVASVNRGCKAVTLSGGVNAYVENVGVTRGPVFRLSSVKEGLKFKKWLDDNLLKLAQVAQKTSTHLKLLKLGTRIAGNFAFVRFYFDTQDAMGMNMATFATKELVRVIESQVKVTCLSLAGNFDIDKKPAWLNVISGRGKRVWAQAVINNKVVKEVLKTTAEKIYDVWLSKCILGSAMSGSLGFNSHFANIIAGIFTATGQDIAHTVEGSIGITIVEVDKNKNLNISIHLPDLMVGTVGGGTGLVTQKEALSLLGVYGGNKGKNALKFAEIVGSAVLAGELSLLASLAEGSLAQAHITFARGNKA